MVNENNWWSEFVVTETTFNEDEIEAHIVRLEHVYARRSTLEVRNNKIYGNFSGNKNEACILTRRRFWVVGTLKEPKNVGPCPNGDDVLKFEII